MKVESRVLKELAVKKGGHLSEETKKKISKALKMRFGDVHNHLTGNGWKYKGKSSFNNRHVFVKKRKGGNEEEIELPGNNFHTKFYHSVGPVKVTDKKGKSYYQNMRKAHPISELKNIS